MTVLTSRITVEQLTALAELPENRDKTLQLINGEIVEKMPGTPYPSLIAGWIITELNIYLKTNRIGATTTEGAGYRIGDDVLAPDVTYISRARQVGFPQRGFNLIAPDLAFEVISPSDKAKEVAEKIQVYRAHGVIVCVVYPESETMHVYEPGESVRFLTRADALTLPDLLPGFALALADIFPVEDDSEGHDSTPHADSDNA